jgi:protein-S-isoprenylcysteine O-methyltransferase Ste14
LWTRSALALVLVPVFMVLIQNRFILAEEARLKAAFGPAFDAWAARTRRWI